MKNKRKIQFFYYAIVESYRTIIVSVVLILCVYLMFRISHSCSNDQRSALLIGIVASVIATLLLRIFDKYSESCYAFERILTKTELLITYIDTKVSTLLDVDNNRFELWHQYVDICGEASRLTYKEDFYFLSGAISNVVEAVYGKKKIEDIKKANEDLIHTRDKYQQSGF